MVPVLPYGKPPVIVGKGRLEARMTLVPVAKEGPQGGYWIPSLSELEMVLREEGVNAPLDQAAVSAAIEKVKAGLRVEVIAARGWPPEPGKDGWVEHLVDLSGPIPPAQVDGGNVDLKTSSLIRNVKSGQPLAVVHPPAVGKAGLDVYGKVLPSQPGKNAEPRIGANVLRASQDPNLLVSATDGHVRLQDGRLEVEECFLVPSDVDYASGNITFSKSVLVQGDVKAGFSVEAGGDVEVQGMVEDCQLRAKGGIFIRGGFAGSGKGRLDAQGEVALAHLRNQAVRSGADVNIAKESVNGRIQSRGKVSVNGLLAGGRTQALHGISCQVAGTETGTTTILEAGFDFTVSEEMAEIRRELGDMGKYAKRLQEGLKHLHDLERLNRGLERWSVELIFQMERMRAKVDAKVLSLRARFAELEEAASQVRDAVITVRRKTYPGTVIKIGEDVFRVDEALEGPKTFRNKEGIIEVLSDGSSPR